ncbi:MAG TPA: alpha/beta hydrolase [Pseudonocardiaceae bacterium]|nr:alpha/beta hydrolase [Pseudonocardiaceae bacterium]
MRIETRVVRMADGQELWVDAVGADGYPLLVHAGSPGSRRLYAPSVAEAHEHGFRLISYDRPGLGDSPAKPGRLVSEGAAQTRAVAEAFGIDRMAMWGFSGGGPYTLACAALAPDLVAAACVFASPSPFIRMGDDYVRADFTAETEEMLRMFGTPDAWLARWGDRAGTDDSHGRQMAEYLALVTQDGVGKGDQGWWDDYNAIHRPWGFDMADIRCPVQLWYGELDRNCPPAHGRWLADHIPGVEVHCFPDEDHSTIEPDHRGEAYGWLAERLQLG